MSYFVNTHKCRLCDKTWKKISFKSKNSVIITTCSSCRDDQKEQTPLVVKRRAECDFCQDCAFWGVESDENENNHWKRCSKGLVGDDVIEDYPICYGLTADTHSCRLFQNRGEDDQS